MFYDLPVSLQEAIAISIAILLLVLFSIRTSTFVAKSYDREYYQGWSEWRLIPPNVKIKRGNVRQYVRHRFIQNSQGHIRHFVQMCNKERELNGPGDDITDNELSRGYFPSNTEAIRQLADSLGCKIMHE